MERVNEQVAEKIIDMVGKDAIRRVREHAAEIARSRATDPCGARTFKIVSKAIHELRTLEKQFGLTGDPAAAPDQSTK